jgi:anti-anti-sigma regulatory factor
MLPVRLDSTAAVGLARTLADRQGVDVVLDATAVELLGARALQTILIAAAAWRVAGHALSVINIPSGVRTQLADLGLSDARLIEGGAL